jgi:hypothetical protein
MHTIERVALFHLLFEGIHPFIAGNGRTGRLLLNFELISSGFPAVNAKFTDRKSIMTVFLLTMRPVVTSKWHFSWVVMLWKSQINYLIKINIVVVDKG